MNPPNARRKERQRQLSQTNVAWANGSIFIKQQECGASEVKKYSKEHSQGSKLKVNKSTESPILFQLGRNPLGKMIGKNEK